MFLRGSWLRQSAEIHRGNWSARLTLTWGSLVDVSRDGGQIETQTHWQAFLWRGLSLFLEFLLASQECFAFVIRSGSFVIGEACEAQFAQIRSQTRYLLFFLHFHGFRLGCCDTYAVEPAPVRLLSRHVSAKLAQPVKRLWRSYLGLWWALQLLKNALYEQNALLESCRLLGTD